ncbi:MAG: Mu-like prophage major head subunit gpT family protein, partial [Treponemataceae bacterium]
MLVSNIVGEGTGTPWFILSLNKAIKPFILQERMKAELESIQDTKSEIVFMKDKFVYGGRWRGAFGYGLWQQAVASKAALNANNFEAAIAQMESFKRDGGDPMGIMATHLVVPSSLRSAGENLVKKQNLANGESNINYNKVELIVSPWL